MEIGESAGMTSNNLLTADVIRNCRDFFRKPHCLKPIDVNGKKYYILCAHPDPYYKFKVLCARAKYKHERWVERYNRWRASRGEPPYQEIVPEVGVFDGVNFVEE